MIKRISDIFFAGLALLLLSPLFILIALALKLSGEGEIFYRQKRVGRDGHAFNILKFATMLKNSESLPGGDITKSGDPRILPLGHFLRSTKINELPQLINVVSGDMSIIGPRPLTVAISALFPKEHWDKLRGVRPGLSGIGSVVFRDEERLLAGTVNTLEVYREAIVPHKAALERWYAAHQTFLLDIKLIVLTIAVIFRPRLNLKRYLLSLPEAPPALAALRARHLRTTGK